MQRNFEAAKRVIDRALAIAPKSFSLCTHKAQLAVVDRGDLTFAEKSLAEFEQEKAQGKLKDRPEIARVASRQGQSAHASNAEFEEVVETLRQFPADETAEKAHGVIEAALLEGTLIEKLGRTAEARAAFMNAKSQGRSGGERSAGRAFPPRVLGVALAHLGEKEAAIAEAKRAIALRPESVDAFEGPDITRSDWPRFTP